MEQAGSQAMRVVAGLYPLMLAMMVGLGWMDGTWFQHIRGGAPGPLLDAATRAIADMLAWVLALTALAGVLSAALAQGAPRGLIVASLLVLCLEFVVPAVSFLLPPQFSAPGTGRYLRTTIHLAALALAVLAWRRSLS